MIRIDCGAGFVAVPRDAVTLNGMPLPQLNTESEPYNGLWCLIAPNGRAISGESGARHYIYRSLEEAKEDAAHLATCGEWGTCR